MCETRLLFPVELVVLSMNKVVRTGNPWEIQSSLRLSFFSFQSLCAFVRNADRRELEGETWTPRLPLQTTHRSFFHLYSPHQLDSSPGFSLALELVQWGISCSRSLKLLGVHRKWALFREFPLHFVYVVHKWESATILWIKNVKPCVRVHQNSE